MIVVQKLFSCSSVTFQMLHVKKKKTKKRKRGSKDIYVVITNWQIKITQEKSWQRCKKSNDMH